MPFDAVLPIFPPGSLDSSIITTTWIGIFIVAFFNLRFGWVLSGLIVPGYLVPLILIKPWAAAVILLESVVTYLLVWLYSEVAPAGGRVHSLFGRDRFFALVLVSVLVRIFFDGWALPLLGGWMNDWLDISFDYRNNLQSFGLIIIALLANQYWKTGLRGAVVPVAVTVGLTLLITRYVLMEFTNFRISDIGYLYEDVAASILASPKAYIILITTAFIASRMNLHYGWEYNGILIPALLAMQWFQPVKILTSLLEALVIYMLAVALLRSPLLANRNIEGARKLVLFFNVGFAWKMLLGWTLPIFQPEWKSSDFFGFGYLLSTLIAIKVHDKGILARLTRATLQTSVVGVAFATAIGFSLVLVSQRPLENVFATTKPALRAVRQVPGSLREVLEAEKIALYAMTRPAGAPGAAEVEVFRTALLRIGSYLEGGAQADLGAAQQILGGVSYELAWVEQRYLLIRESGAGARRGWGSYLLDTRHAGALLIELPDPLELEGLTDAAMLLLEGLDAGGLAMAGLSRHRLPAAGQDVLREFGTFFQVFHRAFGDPRALQLRGYTPATRRALGVPGGPEAVPEAQLWIKGRLPPGLDLVRLQAWTGGFAMHWGEPKLHNVQSASVREGFAQLFLGRAEIRALRFRSLLAERRPAAVPEVSDTADLLENRLLLDRDVIAGAGTERHRPPSLSELMFADVELLTPMVDLVRRADQAVGTGGDGLQLLALDRAAGAVGMEVRVLNDAATGGRWLILRDAAPPASRYLGTYVFRLDGDHAPLALQVPRPRYEQNTVAVALELFRSLDACCLFVAGAHAWANADGSADPVRAGARQSLFSLVSQVFLREFGPGTRLAVQVRGFSADEDAPVTDADRILAVHNGAIRAEHLTPLARSFHDLLQARGGITRLAGAEGAEDVRFGIGRLQQAAYLDATDAGEFAVLWLSSALRGDYRDTGVSDAAAQQFLALEISVQAGNLDRLLAGRPRDTAFDPGPALRDLLADYVAQRDILLLARLQASWRGSLQLLQDAERGESFVVFGDAAGRVAAVARLRDAPGVQEQIAEADAAIAGLKFAPGARWLVFR